ncbi:MAG TPA: hypothetical protein VGC35_14390 [Allosphingosinicella sp.]|jgi:hypothetical protein
MAGPYQPRRGSTSVLLCAGLAAAGLGSCSAEPTEPRSGVQQTELVRPADAVDDQAVQPAQPERDIPEAIDFAADIYLKDVCRHG